MFKAYTEQFLAPTLKRGDIVFMDNVSVHKVPAQECLVYPRLRCRETGIACQMLRFTVREGQVRARAWLRCPQRKMTKRAPACFSSARRGAIFCGSGIRDARCAGLKPSRPDRACTRRHLYRLLVSLHRALVRRLPARDRVLCEAAKEIAPAFR
jgi:hypothetical protein